MDRNASINIDDSGVTKFLICKEWWDHYKNLNTSPDQIDNKSLVKNSTNNIRQFKIRSGIEENKDFVIVSENEWRSLVSQFGGGPEIEVFLIEGRPDINPISIDVWVVKGNSSITQEPKASFWVSDKITLEQLKKFLCNKLQVSSFGTEIEILGKNSSLRSCEDMIVSNLGIGNFSKICLREENSNFCYNANDDFEDEEFKRAIQLSLNEAENKEHSEEVNCDFIKEELKPSFRNDTKIWDTRIMEAFYGKKVKLRIQKLNRVRKNMKKIEEAFKKHLKVMRD